jgi:hypothetical protein
MASDPQAKGQLDLVVGGAVRRSERWDVSLLERYWTAVVTKPTFDFEAPCTSRIIRDRMAIVVGCPDGGSNLESFVLVVGLNKRSSIARINLAVTCGQTHWRLLGSGLVLVSSSLRGGYEVPGTAQPNINLKWGSPENPLIQPATVSDGNNFFKYCSELTYSNQGPL